MATKKQPPKKAAKPAKQNRATAGKSPAKPSRPTGNKAVPKKAAKPSSVKPAAKKAAPVSKKPLKKAPAPVLKKTAPVAKKPVIQDKKIVHPAPPVKAAVPVKQGAPVEPVKKPAVTAPSHQEIKPAIKPLVKPVPKKDPPKPTKVIIPKTSTTKAVKYDPDFTRSVLDTPQHVNTGPTMRYSDAELAEFRELILKKLETAKKELAYLQGLITRKDEGGDMEDGRYMTMEDGSMSMEREQLSQMASRQIQFIDHLEKAMMRIENKTYGICRVTGKLIDKARLRAVPHATLSIEAKQMMNK
jgi:RNA polymerase-binding transcription factor DksA